MVRRVFLCPSRALQWKIRVPQPPHSSRPPGATAPPAQDAARPPSLLPRLATRDPHGLARLILRRAGITPLLPGALIAALVVPPTPGQAHSAGGARVTALASARATIVRDVARVGPATDAAASTQPTVYSTLSLRLMLCDEGSAAATRAATANPIATAPARCRAIIRDMH